MKKKSTKSQTTSKAVKISNKLANKELISNIQDVQELIKFVSKSGIAALELDSGPVKLHIKVHNSGLETTAVSTLRMPVPSAPAIPTLPVTESKPAPTATVINPDSGLQTIKSPMIGTFYRSPGPDKGPFVNVGDRVENGTTVCIIEAMKLFNEIESDIKGKIVKILVDDASPVEYDQPLFLVDPS